MDLRDGAETMSLDGRSYVVFLPDVDRKRVLYLALFPDLLGSLHADHMMTHRLRPINPAPRHDTHRVLVAHPAGSRGRRAPVVTMIGRAYQGVPPGR
jgi:hypothetical protein